VKKDLLLIVNGFEEIEAISSIDVMRRGGLNVTIAAVGCHDLVITGANKIKILADYFLRELEPSNFAAVVLPGGSENAKTLASDELAQMVIKKFYADKRLVAAICAAPIALDAAGVLHGEYACYPGCEQSIQNANNVIKPVVISDNIITSRGPATAICFGIAIVEQLVDTQTASNVKRGLLADFC